jgi:hypothetical protein
MKIIKDKNNIVTHAGEDLELTAEGLFGPGFRSPTVTTKTHTLETVDSIPSDWTGGDYAYDGTWTLTTQGTAKKQAEFDAAKDQKYKDLSQYAKNILSNAMSDYSEWEAISWPLLISEADQFQIDGTVGEYMAAEIGVKYPTAADLAAVILQRKDSMKALRAGVVMVRQAKEAQIEDAETMEDLNAIDIQEGWGVQHGIQRKRLFAAESSRFKQDWIPRQDMGFKQHHGGF